MEATVVLKWAKIEAGHYSARVGEHERIDVVEHYHAGLRQTSWVATHHVEGKFWERTIQTELGRWPTLRAAKAALAQREVDR